MPKVVIRLFSLLLILSLLIGPGLIQPEPVAAAGETLYPNADGFLIELDRFGPFSTNWEACSTDDSDTSYVYTDHPDWWIYDFYNLPDVSLTGTINSVTVGIVAKRADWSGEDSVRDSARSVIMTNSETYLGSSITLTTDWAAYTTTYTTNPYTTTLWTWDEIDDLQAGVVLRSASPDSARNSMCTHVYVIISYNLPAPPSVTTDFAFNITTSSAELYGTLSDLGTASEVKVKIQYSAVSDTGPWDDLSEATMTSTGSFNRLLSGIASCNTYYFRAAAKGDGDWVYGEAKSFFILCVEPTVTTLPATDIGISSATLNMSYTLGDYSPVDAYFAYKKAAESIWIETAALERTADGTHTEALTGLDPGTTYDFKAQLEYG